ncbi:hypothetical protein EGR_09940 [Echinococcus granulosus]|uniref:Uncharacterized protein n=1 Tax=Echinococcus granulosus TaxID=6210 RepID=W6UP49_ECHGR|nr:hypothetical protein EGR_09940 [Echinococcus granulosus]EUB55199.1 hypothetical protein EGR_09940 [Echinococcus granulosus]
MAAAESLRHGHGVHIMLMIGLTTVTPVSGGEWLVFVECLFTRLENSGRI